MGDYELPRVRPPLTTARLDSTANRPQGRWTVVDVYEAVTSRRAVRGFADEPVSREVLERVLSAAAWAPSGSNVQPWRVYVVTGVPLAQLKKLATERVAAVDDWHEREYVMYPPTMKSPYGERRSAFGKERYSALGIEREDWEARMRAAIANWEPSARPVRRSAISTATWACPQ
jgi:nitroreductase